MWFSSRKRSRGAQPRTIDRVVQDNVQPLEKRALLAGNATVTMSGGSLVIVGDGAANSVEVTVVSGNVVVRGLQNTTLNGSTANFVVASDTDTTPGLIIAVLGAGDDTLMFSRNVKVSGPTVVDAGYGNDNIGSTGATFQGGLRVNGRQGNDRISLVNTTVAGLLWLKTKTGDDIVSLDGVTVNGRLTVRSGRGDDNVVLNNVTVAERTALHTNSDNDNVAIKASTFNGHAQIRTRQHEDVVVLEGNTFNQQTYINTGRNVDTVLARTVNTFNGLLTVNAGDGHVNQLGNGDAVEIASTAVVNAGRAIRRNESTTAPASVISTRIDNATTGAYALADAADKFFADLLVSSVQPLSLDFSENETVSSVGGVLITRDQNFVIKGTTTPLSTVALDTDNDGQFDDGSVTANESGQFSVTTPLTRRDLYTSDANTNDQLAGVQTIRLQSTDEAGSIQTGTVTVDYVVGTVIRFASNAGTYEVELFDTAAPISTANFINYLPDFNNSILHRKATASTAGVNVIQGGGFNINNGVINDIPTDAPITNEFNAARTNIRGTLAMARTSDVNSATSQWYINTTDNLSLSTPANPFAVFGRVVGNGMTVVDAMFALNTTNLASASGVSALTDVPLRSAFTPLNTPLAGTVSTTANSNVITGVGTQFTQLTSAQSNPGGSRSQISINGGPPLDVISIDNDTRLTVATAPTETITNGTARTSTFSDDAFVRFSTISEILDQI